MSDFEAIETREQFEEAVKDRLEQERETVRREFSGCLSPEAVEEKYKEYWCGIKKVDSLFSRIS